MTEGVSRADVSPGFKIGTEEGISVVRRGRHTMVSMVSGKVLFISI